MTPAAGTPSLGLLDGVSSSAISTNFPTPSDYVSGTVTIKALISGCGGNNVLVSISRSGLNVGSNGLLIILPTTQVVAIPPNPSLFTFFVVEVSTTVSGFFDLNRVSLARIGADALDTCAGTLNVQGYIIEYPRG